MQMQKKKYLKLQTGFNYKSDQALNAIAKIHVIFCLNISFVTDKIKKGLAVIFRNLFDIEYPERLSQVF